MSDLILEGIILGAAIVAMFLAPQVLEFYLMGPL